MREDESFESSPLLVGDGRDGAYVVWATGHRTEPEQYDADLYAQHITGKGTVASGWPEAGKLVAGEGGDQHLAAVAADRGGVLVAWFDDSVEDNVRVAWLGPTGLQTDWGAGPRATSVERIAIAPAGRASAYVAWTSNDIATKRPYIMQWNRGEPIQYKDLAAPTDSREWDPSRLGLVPDGRAGALVIWQDSNSKSDPPNRWVIRVSKARP
jgi:hypothetical protein